MVLRLLAFNAEAWIAEHLAAYLADSNEHRSIHRHLLYLEASVDYSATVITVSPSTGPTPHESPAPSNCSLRGSPTLQPTPRPPSPYHLRVAATPVSTPAQHVPRDAWSLAEPHPAPRRRWPEAPHICL